MTDSPPRPDGAALGSAPFTTSRLAIEPLSVDHAAGLHAALGHLRAALAPR